MGLARSVLALGQLSVLLFTPSSYLFVPIGDPGPLLTCEGFPQALSAYCLPNLDRQTVSWGLLLLLAAVASGVYPRVTGILHAWAAFSIHAAISLPDGGETVAQVCTLFIALVTLSDRRRWHWSAPTKSITPVSPVLHGLSWAAQVALTMQVAHVYLNSAISKLKVPQWQDGSALYYVVRMESFGVSGWSGDVLLCLTKQPLVSLVMTWGVLASEVAIALLLMRNGKWPAVALAISCVLHLGIIFQLGLVSFGTIMIGVVSCAAAPAIGEKSVYSPIAVAQADDCPSAISTLAEVR